MPHLNVELQRYETSYVITSKLDPFSDVLNLTESLTSTDYVIEVLSAVHGITGAAARSRAKAICPHVRTAIQYVQQSLNGPPEVSFLPTYYAMLCFSKVYVLLGPKHALLPTGHHGVSYLGRDKDSQTLLTEEIRLRPDGAIPLLYETLTGLPITKKGITLTMGDVYPYLADVGAEHHLIAGAFPKLARLVWSFVPNAHGDLVPMVTVEPLGGPPLPKPRELKVLRGFKANPTKAELLTGPTLPKGTDPLLEIRKHLRPELLYTLGDRIGTPVSAKHLLLPEELPIALAFFHLSSVVRYKPEFFEKLRDSRYWPVVNAARRHCLFKSLVLFWSFVRRQSLMISHA